MDRPEEKDRLSYKINISDSTFMGMLFARGKTIWFPREYLSAAALVKKNSEDKDIVYSSLNIVGVILASISERPTANALFPEIAASKKFDPFLSSKIIVFTKDEETSRVDFIVNKYNLTKIGENKIFILYKNPSCDIKAHVNRASVTFSVIGLISLGFVLAFWLIKN